MPARIGRHLIRMKADSEYCKLDFGALHSPQNHGDNEMAKAHFGRREVEKFDLPPLCMKCGQPTDHRVSKRFAWHPGWVMILIFVGLLVYVIVAIILTKRMRLSIPMCSRHLNHWLLRNLIILLGFGLFGTLGIAAVYLTIQKQHEDLIKYLYGVAIFGGLAWLIVSGVIVSNSIRPSQITDRGMTLINVNKEFRDAWDAIRGATTADKTLTSKPDDDTLGFA